MAITDRWPVSKPTKAHSELNQPWGLREKLEQTTESVLFTTNILCADFFFFLIPRNF